MAGSGFARHRATKIRLEQLRPLLLALFVGAFLLASSVAQAGSATWNFSQTTGEWESPDNWTPATVPNGPDDVATFAATDRKQVRLSSSVTVNSIVFAPDATAYNITVSGFRTELTMVGPGILNQSGLIQTFVGKDYYSHLTFLGNATAGEQTTFLNRGSSGLEEFSIFFYDSTSANHATIVNLGATASAAPGGYTKFYDSSTAEAAIIINEPATGFGDDGGLLFFYNDSTAGNATITNNGGWSEFLFATSTEFHDNATAGSSTITSNGAVDLDHQGAGTLFFGNSTAGTATLIVNGDEDDRPGAYLWLADASDAGTARVEVFGAGRLDISVHDSPGVATGSLEGDGLVFLGGNNLTVGGTGLSTEFAGVIQDGGHEGGTGGSLTKIGSGEFTLSGASIYTGSTTVSAGTLVVANTSGSATGMGPVSVTGGTLGGSGIIAGAVTVGTGSGDGAVLAPAHGGNKQLTLTVQGSLTFNSDATYTYTFKAKGNRSKIDKVIANGVTINSGATIVLSGTVQGNLTQGMVLTLIKNTAATPIAGTFSNLPDGGIVNVKGNNLQANYSGGDGNDLTLTVVP